MNDPSNTYTEGGFVNTGSISASGDVVGRDKNVYGYTYEQALELIQTMRRADQPKAWDGRTPYVGLAAFQEQDAALFFGRERLIDVLTTQLRASSSLAVFGPSGSGKSSVIRAGLLVALKQGALNGSDKWLYATLSPGDHPIAHLADALSAMALKAGFAPSLSNDLRLYGQTHPQSLYRLGHLLTQDTSGKQLVVFVDQFEESFTLTHDAEERQAFFDLLTTVVNQPDGRTKVILSARSDFLSQCAAHPDLRRMINAQFRLIGAMDPEELARAIVMPAMAVGASVQPALVSTMINETQGDPGMLPLMQFALKDLWDAQPHKIGQPVELTLDAYTARGGMHQILERRADAIFNTLSPAQQVLAQRIFTGLIEVGHGTLDTRRTARIEDVVPVGTSQIEALGVIQVLSDGRLLTTTADKDDSIDHVKGTVTIVHERLIDAWPWLRKLVDERRQAIARQNVIADDAKEWEAHGRNASFLYTDARLKFVLAEIEANELVLGEQARALLDASQTEQARREWEARLEQDEKLTAAQKLAEEQQARAEAERQRADDQAASSRRLRHRAVYLAVALALAVAAVFGALWFANESRINSIIAQQNALAEVKAKNTAIAASNESFARELARTSENNLLTDPQLSILLALQAVTTTQSSSIVLSQAEDALHKAVAASHTDLILPRRDGSVTSISYSPDGKSFALTDETGRVEIRDSITGSIQQTFTYTSPNKNNTVFGVNFSPDGMSLAIAYVDKKASVWNIKSGKKQFDLLGHTNGVIRVIYSKNGKRIATAGLDGTARIWDSSTGRELLVITDTLVITTAPGVESGISSVSFSPDGKLLATGGNSNIPKIWDAISGELVKILVGHTARVYDVQFSPDGAMIGTTSADGTSRLWNMATATTIYTLIGHSQNISQTVYSSSFSNDGNFFATGSADKTVRIWQIKNAKEKVVLAGHTDWVWGVGFSPDSQHLISTGRDGTVRVWSTLSKELVTLSTSNDMGVNTAAFSFDGSLIASGDSFSTIRIWDLKTDQILRELYGHGRPVYSVTFHPYKHLLASGSLDGTAVLWDTKTWLPVYTLTHNAQVLGVAFDSNGDLLATAGTDGLAKLWDLDTGKLIRIFKGHSAELQSVIFDPRGRRMATSSNDRSVIIWDVTTGQPVITLTGHTDLIVGITYSPDGKHIATASYDQTARIWNSDTGALENTLIGHSNAVTGVAFSHDGKRIATASVDQSVRIWNVETGENIITLGGHTDQVKSISTSRDGNLLLTSSFDGTVRVYLWNIVDLINLAEKRVHRTFTSSECMKYMHMQQCPS